MKTIVLSLFLFICSAIYMDVAMSYGNICNLNCTNFRTACIAKGGTVVTSDVKAASYGNQYINSYLCRCNGKPEVADQWVIVPNGC